MEEPVVKSVVEKVVDLLFIVSIKEISYMWNCKENVKKLKNEVENLKDMKGRVQQKIEIANSKGDILFHGVEHWVVAADEEISKAEVFLEQEANAKKTRFKIGVRGNWGTLYHYGKMATKMIFSILRLQESGKIHESGVSIDTPAPTQKESHQKKNFDGLVTHHAILDDIIKSLENENIQIIGIYGLGGVGKTELAMEGVARVKNTLFDEVAVTTVSQSVDANKIQKDTESARKKIVQGKKVLIVLDDVWEKLNLEKLCIPCGSEHKNCKILLTSRSKDVCEKMNAQSKICVNSLPTEEAWILFKRVVGERLETEADLQPVAKEVAQECGGLPLLIQDVGNALKNKKIILWSVALSKLKKHALSEIDPDIKKAFARLKLSYEDLKSEEAKSCFLLCCLFPEDKDIELEELVYYGVALGKFGDLDSMEDARGRVQNAVNILTSSSLLLDVRNYEEVTKMHDVVRQVAFLIASEGKNKYLVKAGKGLTEWLPRDDNLKDYTGISLMYNKISKLPNYEVRLSSLEIFLANNNPHLTMISDEFIKSMKEVRVLDLSECPMTQLPQSLGLLTKLRMLNLTGNKSLHEISILGEMKELEILILNRTGIKEIPKEIDQLVNLRRLEVSRCRYMTRVTPGVISKLEKLEELFIEFSQESEGVYECLVEVKKLSVKEESKLTYLYLKVESFHVIPEGFISQKLKGFFIQVGGDDRFHPDLKTTSNSEYSLYRIENLNSIMPDLYYQGVNKVETINLRECPNVSCLVDDSTSHGWDKGKTKEKLFMQLKHLELGSLKKFEVLWKCPDEYVSLTNLVTLSIYNCHKLVRLFPVSVAQGLVNLKKLKIENCDGLEQVIWGWDKGKTKEKLLMQLKHLELGSLNKLEVIWKCRDEYISLTNLVTLSIYNCHKLVRLFTVSVAQRLVNLKDLEIENCDGLEQVIWGGETEEIVVFHSLANISLNYLSSLKSFFNSAAGNGNCNIIKYPSLVYVKMEVCKSMKKWGVGIHETPNLKTLVVNHVDVQVLDGPNAINEAVEKYWRMWKQDHDIPE